MSTPIVTPEVTPEPEILQLTQAKLDEIIQKAMGRAGKEARQEAADVKAQMTKLQAELADAKRELATAKTPTERKEAKGDVAELEGKIEEIKNASKQTMAENEGLRSKLQESDAKVKKAEADALEQRKENKMASAAAKEDFVDLDLVMYSTRRFIQWNEGENKWIVINENGEPRLNSSFDPMTVEQFYQDYAAKHPYLVKGRVIPGTGQKPSDGSTASVTGRYTVEQLFGPKSSSKLANEVANKNIAEYRRLKAEAIQKGLIAG